MSLDGLSLEAQQALDNYLLQLSSCLQSALLEVRDSLVSEVENHVQSQLHQCNYDLHQLKALLAELGEPEIHATRVTNSIWLVYLQQEAAKKLQAEIN